MCLDWWELGADSSVDRSQENRITRERIVREDGANVNEDKGND